MSEPASLRQKNDAMITQIVEIVQAVSDLKRERDEAVALLRAYHAQYPLSPPCFCPTPPEHRATCGGGTWERTTAFLATLAATALGEGGPLAATPSPAVE